MKFGVANYFPMAVGNMACKLITYAEHDYDKGHSDIFCNEAYQLLLEALEGNLDMGLGIILITKKKDWRNASQ